MMLNILVIYEWNFEKIVDFMVLRFYLGFVDDCWCLSLDFLLLVERNIGFFNLNK